MGFLKLKRKKQEVTPIAAGGNGNTYRLDTLGQVCPFPLVEAKNAIAGLNAGDLLQIDFDCTQATDSIPAWAAQAGYPVVDFRQVGEAQWSITIAKN
ncbi:sulfurtransferase TusA family protein [Arcanobacterium hippocoleae]